MPSELERLKTDCDIAADIAAVVVRYVPEMKPAGREFKALCPFHDDHSPSMCVVPHKNIYQCFACGAGGDQYSFVMRVEGLDFPDAVRRVAEILGIKTDGKKVTAGEREVRESKGPAPVEMMTPRQILDEYRWYRDHAYPVEEWSNKLGVNPMAFQITKMVVAPYRLNHDVVVLVAPMRNDDGVLCSLRFRDFETKRRWSLDRKENRVQVARTSSGLMACEEVFDPDICLDGTKDMIIEGETDLLGGISILLRDYSPDPVEWPVRIIALPGVQSCHDLVLSMPLSSVVVTFFDLDDAGCRAAFNHKPMMLVEGEDGRKHHQINHSANREPGLLAKLGERGVQARACFPPESEDGSKYDLRDMARGGWSWSQLADYLLSHSTADVNGVRVKRRIDHG